MEATALSRKGRLRSMPVGKRLLKFSMTSSLLLAEGCAKLTLMRKAFLIFAILLILSETAFAATQMEPKGTMMRKFQRGFINLGLSPIELSHELHKEKGNDAYLPSWVSGLFRGSAFTVGRALSGAYDLVTFPVPLPSGYESLVYPELVTDHLEDTK